MLISYGFIFQPAKVHNIFNNVEAFPHYFQFPYFLPEILGRFKNYHYLCARLIIVELKINVMNNIESNTGEIVMYQPDETIRLEVRVEDETVWLSQAQMAELFGTKRQAITKHLQNIYECDELKKEATSSILELVRKEGNRTVKRKVEFYNLDAIISVGFRVNTKRGIEFRQWANRVLKNYMLRGYVVNSRIMALEQHVAEQDTQIKDLKNKVDFFVRSSLPPVEGIFFDGQIFDAYVQIASLIKQAKRSITLIDDVVYLFGASLKDAGKKLFAYIKMQETPAAELLNNIR